MVGKNNQYVKKIKQGTKVETYSIKKFKVGIASVVIGCSVFFGAGAVAMAGEQPIVSTNTNEETNEGLVTTSSNKESAITSAERNTKLLKEVETTKGVVDITKLEKLVKDIEKLNLAVYTEESVRGLKEELDKAKKILIISKDQKEVESTWKTLFIYKNTRLKLEKKNNNPLEDKTTNGKTTKGIKAKNTEPNSTNIAGHNHSVNGTTLPEGSGLRAAPNNT
ncbi:YSIRK-type signal peptide-containing protein, partial [uncultured Gemella sp.]